MTENTHAMGCQYQGGTDQICAECFAWGVRDGVVDDISTIIKSKLKKMNNKNSENSDSCYSCNDLSNKEDRYEGYIDGYKQGRFDQKVETNNE